MRRRRSNGLLAALVAGAAIPAIVQISGSQGGFAAGLGHPIGGLDHLLAMVAVGIWAAQRGGRALWPVPAAFMAAMVMGGVLGMTGLGLPGAEAGILASVMVLGALVALDLHPPLAFAMAIAGVFAVFHGYAHGAEMPEATAPVLYAAGFLLATGILHVAGVAVAQVAGKALAAPGNRLVRAGGAVIAASGAALMVL